jgi:galactose mutarotase-like enzyme
MASAEPTISTEWSLVGQPAVVLENRFLRAVVLPGLGGKIISLLDKRADVELLWRNSRVPVRPVPVGATFDDHFLGGWDEMFPNDISEELAGEVMPDHGEVWTSDCATRIGRSASTVWLDLESQGVVTGARLHRRLTLSAGPELITTYRLESTAREPLPFLWKSHVAVALQHDTVIDLAAREVSVHEFGRPRVRPQAPTFSWPVLEEDGISYDFRQLPDTTGRGCCEFLMAHSMTDGRCGVRHRSAGTGLRLEWDLAELPSCWTFASHGGGWRGLDVLVLEPCTGYGLSVAEGVEQGSHQVLQPGELRQWRITARVGT